MKKLNKTIYFVSEKTNIKKKILKNLENQLIEDKL
jgi:cytoskeletal protein RodZ